MVVYDTVVHAINNAEQPMWRNPIVLNIAITVWLCVLLICTDLLHNI